MEMVIKSRRPNSLRLPNYDYSTAGRYFLTLCTKSKQEVFLDAKIRQITLHAVRQISNWSKVRLDAFCIMPDHLHFLLVIENDHDYNISGFVRNFKSKTYHELKRSHGFTESLWQRNFYDHIIRNESDYWEKFWYIVRNPIKGGLTEEEFDLEFVYVKQSI
jgi:putative transposase